MGRISQLGAFMLQMIVGLALIVQAASGWNQHITPYHCVLEQVKKKINNSFFALFFSETEVCHV